MLRSMTGFASDTGTLAPYSWSWELRSVNGKGQDIRLRVPDWIDGLEVALRKLVATATVRGNITMSLRMAREDHNGALQINQQQLASVLDAMSDVEEQAMAKGLSLAPSKASDIIALRGILEASAHDDDVVALRTALLAQAETLIAAYTDMRVSEGTALTDILQQHLDEIEALTVKAAAQAGERADSAAETLRRNIARVLDATDAVDEARLAQELAVIAVKSDVTEEIDRLKAHVSAARELIASGGAVGRKLDFLMQEFNREANTLCSKAQSTELTRSGLALKAVIDQMREQVQNVE